MKAILASGILVAVLVFPAWGEPLRPVSEVAGVTVFTDRAAVTRSARVTLPRGSSTIVIDGLPVSIQEDSLRVSSRGTARGVIASVDLRSDFLDRPADERVRRLEEELAAAVSGVDVVEGRLRSLASQRAFVESIRVGYAERVSRELGGTLPSAESLGRMLSFVGETLQGLSEKERQAEREKRDATARVDALKRELARLREAAARESRRAEIGIATESAGTADIEVSYIVPNAGWQPAYEVRLNPDGKTLDLLYRALVRQKTGEDWNNVTMLLSTARPALGGGPPDLRPWNVSLYEPRLYQMAAPAAAPPPREMMMKRMEERDAAEMPHEEGMVEEGRTSVTFEVPRTASIPGDGFPHGVTLSRQTLPAKLEYVAVPKLAPHAYLRATVENGAQAPVLPGNAALFVDGSFTGNQFLRAASAGEKLELYLGSDEGIRVKRVEMKRKKEGGFLSANAVSYRYRVEVSNHRKGEAAVVVKDQLPLPQNEELKVTLVESLPAAERDAETGELSWKLELKPGEKRDIFFEFRVEYPKDRTVEGL